MLFQKYMKQYGACKATPIIKHQKDFSRKDEIECIQRSLSKKGFEQNNSGSNLDIDTSQYNGKQIDWNDYSVIKKVNARGKSIETLAETNQETNTTQKAKLFVVKIEVNKGVVKILRFNENNNPYGASQIFVTFIEFASKLVESIISL